MSTEAVNAPTVDIHEEDHHPTCEATNFDTAMLKDSTRINNLLTDALFKICDHVIVYKTTLEVTGSVFVKADGIPVCDMNFNKCSDEKVIKEGEMSIQVQISAKDNESSRMPVERSDVKKVPSGCEYNLDHTVDADSPVDDEMSESANSKLITDNDEQKDTCANQQNLYETDINKNAVCDKMTKVCEGKICDITSMVKPESEENIVNVQSNFNKQKETIPDCDNSKKPDSLLKNDQSFVTSLMSEALKVWYNEDEGVTVARDSDQPSFKEEMLKGINEKTEECTVPTELDDQPEPTDPSNVGTTNNRIPDFVNKQDATVIEKDAVNKEIVVNDHSKVGHQNVSETKERLKELVKSLKNGEKLYRCDKCDSSFAFPKNLSVHMQKVHHQSSKELNDPIKDLGTTKLQPTVKNGDGLVNPWNGLFNPALFNMFMPPSPAFLPGSVVNPFFPPQPIGDDLSHNFGGGCMDDELRKQRELLYQKYKESFTPLHVKTNNAHNSSSLEDGRGDYARHSCQQCGQTFTYSSNLRRHIRNIHMEKKDNDDGSLSSDLDDPSLMKDREKSNICALCGQLFYSASELQQHLKSIHKVVIPTPDKQQEQNHKNNGLSTANIKQEINAALPEMASARTEIPISYNTSKVLDLKSEGVRRLSSTFDAQEACSDLSFDCLPPPPKKRFIARVKTEGARDVEPFMKSGMAAYYPQGQHTKENDRKCNEPLDMTAKQLNSSKSSDAIHGLSDDRSSRPTTPHVLKEKLLSESNVDAKYLHPNLTTSNKHLPPSLLLGQLLGQGHMKSARSAEKFSPGTAMYTPLTSMPSQMMHQSPVMHPEYFHPSLPLPTSQLTPTMVSSKGQGNQPRHRKSCDSSERLGSPLLSDSDHQLDLKYPSCMDGKRYVCGLCMASFTFQTNLTRHQRKLHGRPFVRKPHGNDSPTAMQMDMEHNLSS